MQFKYIKPYLFIIAFIIVPLLLIPLLRKVKNNFIDQSIVYSDSLQNSVNFGLVIHGGAGNFTEKDIPDSLQTVYKQKLEEVIHFGMQRIEKGDSAVHVVVAVIKMLEDSPLFNAGKGAVFAHNKKNELDASIMNGIDKSAGAVAGVTTIKNPIEAAYMVMTNSKHVLLAGTGAEAFAKTENIPLVEPNYFYTEKRWKNLQKAISNEKHGTVGCVVLDKNGNLAAGTSTGGMTNKKYGRIGDSPIIGAGTYADNSFCAISATGHGEFFIRYAVAYDIRARMKYLHESLEEASSQVINDLKNKGGNGGVICIDKAGNISMPFNTTGMFRASCTALEEAQILMFKTKETE